jgi:CDP-4-dehydro-6-deoxyglucose reductase
VVLESRQVTDESAFPIKKDALAREQPREGVGRRDDRALQLPANDTLRYHAGQYIEFILRDGARRSYSMANAPLGRTEPVSVTPPGTPAAPSPGIELHIRHMPGGKFTDHVFGAMKEKEILRIEGPYGSFFLRDDSDKPMVLLASGTGFAPIKAVLEHMQAKNITRPATLYWGGRRPGDLYMDAWVRERLAEMPHLRYVPVVSNALPEDNWTGRTGFVHQAVLDDLPDLSATRCMPAARPSWWSRRARYVKQAGLDPEEFFADAFTTEADKAPNE